MTAHVSRQAASKLTITALVVALGGVMGVGALAIGGEGSLPTPPTQPQSTDVEQPQVINAKPKRDIAMWREDVEWNLEDYYNWGEDEQIVEAPNNDGPGQTPNQGPASPIRYLGSIIGPERRLAIVSIDGKQRILAENAEVNGYRLLRVNDDHIVVRRGGGAPTQVVKAPSDGTMVTMIASSSPQDAGAGGPIGVRGEQVEDNLTRTERLRQEALERQRERLGTRDERLQDIERRRNGANNGTGIRDGRNVTATPPRNPGNTSAGGSTSPGGSTTRSSGSDEGSN